MLRVLFRILTPRPPHLTKMLRTFTLGPRSKYVTPNIIYRRPLLACCIRMCVRVLVAVVHMHGVLPEGRPRHVGGATRHVSVLQAKAREGTRTLGDIGGRHPERRVLG